MAKTALVQILERWTGPPEGDIDAGFLSRFLTARDEDAFAALVQRHGPLVYGTCLRILGNRNDTDDAFQAVFFVLARRAHTLKRDRSIGPWLHGVAVRVAKKLRGQLVRRRLREMAAARSERVEAAEPDHDFWALLDEELARIPRPLREVLLLCDLSGQSHAHTAASLGLAKGTVTKRLARAREELATRLKRRGITLGVGGLTTRIATQAPASVPAPLVRETARRAVAFAVGQIGGSGTAKALAEGVMRSLKFGGSRAWLVVGLLGLTLAGGGRLMLAGGPRGPGERQVEQPPARAEAKPEAAGIGTMWKESFTGEYQTSLPVSVAFSADGKSLFTGDTNGEVMALKLPSDLPTGRWKAQAGGSHAAVAYSADRKHVYATTADGVCILDAATGRHVGRIDAAGSNPIAIGVFPNRDSRSQIVFGNARGYFVESWEDGKIADTLGTLETSTVPQGAKPTDAAAVPLAVDPKGRSAIMTGPPDATGQVAGSKGKNVLWAYVCGNYAKDSPGNRVLVGHAATVVAAAWAKEGTTAVTGDADGRVIVWDARTMKERHRVELAGRVLAVGISDDGTHTAACVRGKQGGEFYAWETAKPAAVPKPIHTQQAEFGFEPYASLAFAADGKHLAGCVIDKRWLRLYPKHLLPGQVHVWELAAEPRAQPAPRQLYTWPMTRGGPARFVILDNYTLIIVAEKEGALDFHDLRYGHIQARRVLGKFILGGVRQSSDRRWLALEQHPITNDAGIGIPTETFDVGVYERWGIPRATISSCSQLLDVASGGQAVAVVRDKQIELWDTAVVKKLKAAPFKYTRIDAAQFSPDGKLLAVSDRNELVLWRWQENTHERIDLGRRVGSLTFTPDGRFLAEGPAPGEDIRVRDMETRKVVQTLTNGTKRLTKVPRMASTQGGRVLIAGDTVPPGKAPAVPPRITFWDTASGSVAHQIALPAGSPGDLDVSPNGRYLAVLLDDGAGGRKVGVWRLDGRMPDVESGSPPPASGPR
jgi:RNA polymerase sigma factor (sigma-70 family)